MSELLAAFGVFVAGLIFLVKGSEAFVESAAKLARMLGVSDLVIGLTLVAVGTSLPELFTAVVSSYTGNSEITVGNVLGANIINTTLLLGLSALFAPIPTQKAIIYRDGISLVVYASIFYYFASDGFIAFEEGILLIMLFSLYTLFVFESTRGVEPDSPEKSIAIVADILWGVIKIGGQIGFSSLSAINSGSILQKVNDRLHRVRSLRADAEKLRELAVMAISGVGIYLGGNWFVEGAVQTSKILGLDSAIIGITLVSVGTTMPELIVSIQASRKRLSQIVIGNLLGSNITNMTLIAGVGAIIAPLSLGSTELMRELNISNVIPFMIFVSILCLVLVRTRWEVSRLDGILLLCLYAGFTLWLLSASVHL